MLFIIVVYFDSDIEMMSLWEFKSTILPLRQNYSFLIWYGRLPEISDQRGL